MATQCFTGPGVITLLNSSGSFSVVSATDPTCTIGSFSGTKGKTLEIPGGEWCATYPDSWTDDGSCDEGCQVPAIPVLDFVSEAAPEPVDPTTIPGVDCATPSHVTLCELQDLLDGMTAIQTAIENKQDHEIITSGWVCGASGFYERTVTPYIDGVAGAVQTIVSTTSCDDPAPADFEIRTLCDSVTNTVHLQTVSIDENGVIAVVDDLDTGEICNQDTADIVECDSGPCTVSTNGLQLNGAGGGASATHEDGTVCTFPTFALSGPDIVAELTACGYTDASFQTQPTGQVDITATGLASIELRDGIVLTAVCETVNAMLVKVVCADDEECKKQVLAVEPKYDVIPATTGNTISCEEVGTFTAAEGTTGASSEAQGVNLYRLRWNQQDAAEDQQIIDWLNAGYYVVLEMPGLLPAVQGVIGGPAGFIIESGSPGGSWAIRTDHDGQDDCALYPTTLPGSGTGTAIWTAFEVVGSAEGDPQQCVEIQEIKEQDSCTGEETYRYVIEDGAGALIEYVPQGNVQNTCPDSAEICDPCFDCGFDDSLDGEVQNVLPFEALAKSGTVTLDPATVEAQPNTLTDLSGLVTGDNTELPVTGNEDWLARFDLTEVVGDCGVITALEVVMTATPDSGGWPVMVYDANLDPVLSSAPGGDGWWYQQHGGTNNIVFQGHNLLAGLPTPQPGNGEYTVTMPIDLNTVTDLSVITVASLIMTGNADVIRNVSMNVTVDYSACATDPKPVNRTVIDPECQGKIGSVPVNITNENAILVQVQEAETTELQSSSQLCYPDDDGSVIVVDFIRIISLPSNTVISSDYVVVALGSGTISAGLTLGGSFTPPDFLLLGICDPADLPQIDSRTEEFCAIVDGPDFSSGSKILCIQTYDVALGAIGSGSEVLLYTNYYLESGAVVASFDPATQGGVCPSTVAMAPITLESLCISVDGVAQIGTPVVWGNTLTTGLNAPVYLDSMGNLITGVVTVADECDCECPACGQAKACTLMQGFDYDRGLITPGDTMAFRVLDNGVQAFVLAHDYTTTDTGVVSSHYDPIIAGINALPDWTITLETDVLSTVSGKPTWRVEYFGAGAGELIIQKNDSIPTVANGDQLIIRVDAAGVLTTSVIQGGTAVEIPDFGSPAFSAC